MKNKSISVFCKNDDNNASLNFVFSRFLFLKCFVLELRMKIINRKRHAAHLERQRVVF